MPWRPPGAGSTPSAKRQWPRPQCVLGKKFQPLAIGRLERFAADYERENNLIELPPKASPTGKKIAVIGAGPAGLTVAGDLILLGYEVTIFEAFHKPGGMYSANEYLTRTNLMKAYRFPEYDTPVVNGEHMCVVGGGNVAMDAARVAMRLGSKRITIVYRRSRTELPARAEEVDCAEEEGIIFQLLTNPVALEGDQRGMVRCMKCIRMQLGEPDASGRRRPVPIEGSEFYIDTDLVIVAIGARANPLLTKATPDMVLNRWGYILADKNGRTAKERVWAGGDIITGSATVIAAMGAGRVAAKDIHQYLTSDVPGPWRTEQPEPSPAQAK